MKEIERKIDPNRYQVFLLACHCRLPVSFARHMWFVVNNKGTLSRWEVLIEKNCCGSSWGHVHKDAQALFKSLGLFTIKGWSLWETELVGFIEGVENSIAHKMAEFIEKTKDNYPFLDHYELLGPNSNTYIQWILNHFPDFKVRTPWNAVGKGFKTKV